MKKMLIVTGVCVGVIVCSVGYYFGYHIPMSQAEPVVKGLHSDDRTVVIATMDRISKQNFYGVGRKAVEDALADVLANTDDLTYIRVGIIAAEFHRGGSMRLAEDPRKRAILEKAMEKYNAKTNWEKWELQKCDDGTYFTSNAMFKD